MHYTGLIFICLFVVLVVHGQTFNATTSIRISEVMSHSTPPTGFEYVEIYNAADVQVPLAGWTITTNLNNPNMYAFEGTLASRGYQVTAPNAILFPDGKFSLYLLYNGMSVQNLSFAGSAAQITHSRLVDPVGREHYAQTYPTIGFRNRYPIIGPFVITEVNFNPPAGQDEYIKIRCISSSWQPLRSVTELGPWYLYSGYYTHANRENIEYNTQFHNFILPMDVWMAPNEEAIIVAMNTTAYRIKYQIDASVKVFGPYRFRLDNARESVLLAKEDVMPVVVDEVNYRVVAPWPLNATVLERVNHRSYGDNVRNWKVPGTRIPCQQASDCPIIDTCSVPYCNVGTGSCSYYVRVCTDASFNRCFPPMFCNRTLTPNIPQEFSCTASQPACVGLGDPLPPAPARPANALDLINVAPLARAQMVPDLENTSAWGIDGKYYAGFKADNSTAESDRNATNPRYIINLNRDYTAAELRLIRIWNRFDGTAVSYNYPLTIGLRDSMNSTFYVRNFTAEPSPQNPNVMRYRRVNELQLTSAIITRPLRQIIIAAFGTGRRLSISEVEVLAVVQRDCELSDWLEWTACNASTNTRSRQKIRLVLEANGGQGCAYPIVDTVQCTPPVTTTSQATSASSTGAAGTTSVATGSNPASTGSSPSTAVATTGSVASTGSSPSTAAATSGSAPGSSTGNPASTASPSTSSPSTSSPSTSSPSTSSPSTSSPSTSSPSTASPSTAAVTSASATTSTTGSVAPTTGGIPPGATVLTATFNVQIKNKPTACITVSTIAALYRAYFVQRVSQSFSFFSANRLEVAINVEGCSFVASRKRSSEEILEFTLPIKVRVAESPDVNEPPAATVLEKIQQNLEMGTLQVSGQTSGEVISGSQTGWAVEAPPPPSNDFLKMSWMGLSLWIWVAIGVGALILIIVIIIIAVKCKKSREERV